MDSVAFWVTIAGQDPKTVERRRGIQSSRPTGRRQSAAANAKYLPLFTGTDEVNYVR
jgi:hypothetical protein